MKLRTVFSTPTFLSVYCVAMTYFVISVWLNVREAAHCEPPLPRQAIHLPSKCAQYYDSNSAEWALCMGVGPK